MPFVTTVFQCFVSLSLPISAGSASSTGTASSNGSAGSTGSTHFVGKSLIIDIIFKLKISEHNPFLNTNEISK